MAHARGKRKDFRAARIELFHVMALPINGDDFIGVFLVFDHMLDLAMRGYMSMYELLQASLGELGAVIPSEIGSDPDDRLNVSGSLLLALDESELRNIFLRHMQKVIFCNREAGALEPSRSFILSPTKAEMLSSPPVELELLSDLMLVASILGKCPSDSSGLLSALIVFDERLRGIASLVGSYASSGIDHIKHCFSLRFTCSQ
jgi:hypothetical protein